MSWIRPSLALVACVMVVFIVSSDRQPGAAETSASSFYVLKGDLAEIRRKGSIRFLVHGEADYLPRTGDPRAAERALAEQLANRLGVKAVFISVAEQDDLIHRLNEGNGDVIVGSLAITAGRSKRIAFSRPIRFVDQLVVVKASDTSIQALEDLSGRDVTVREGSSYAEALDRAKVKGIRIKVAPETMQTFDLLQKVGRGVEKITVADSDLFAAATAFAPNIRSAFKLVEKQPIAWGLRAHEMDWRLITAQMYQESGFNPKATSWVGAKGLMQVMPRTAQELRIDNLEDPNNGILAGTRLMDRYSNYFNSPEISAKDRIRFALASYNCGPGHISDARDLAKDMGLDSNKWFGNVEKAMLLLRKREIARKARYGYCRCEEPVNYVSQIQNRYDQYVQLVPLR